MLVKHEDSPNQIDAQKHWQRKNGIDWIFASCRRHRIKMIQFPAEAEIARYGMNRAYKQLNKQIQNVVARLYGQNPAFN